MLTKKIRNINRFRLSASVCSDVGTLMIMLKLTGQDGNVNSDRPSARPESCGIFENGAFFRVDTIDQCPFQGTDALSRSWVREYARYRRTRYYISFR